MPYHYAKPPPVCDSLDWCHEGHLATQILHQPTLRIKQKIRFTRKLPTKPQCVHRNGIVVNNAASGLHSSCPAFGFFPKHHTTTTILRPFFRDHPGEPVPEENFWTLWCKGALTEADKLTIRLGATPSGLTCAHLDHPPIFYRPDALPAAQPTVSKH